MQDRVQGFLSNPKLEFLPDGRTAVLVEDFTYVDKYGRRHTAKKEEQTDGGSIPRFFWRVIGGPFLFCLGAYIIHDHYCKKARTLPKDDGRILRREGDYLFLEMLEYMGIGELKRYLMFWAVRAAGKREFA